MILYFVRHGHPNYKHDCLTDLGKLQAAAAAERLRHFWTAMLINLAAITLSVMGVLTPVSGALVHNAGSVLVVLNAALLYDREI